MPDPRQLAIIDIDGVIADVRHRLHHLDRRPKNWKAFFAEATVDPVHPEGAAVVATLAADNEIVFVTGRPEHLRDDTVAWLDRNGFGGHQLLMRAEGDRRPAATVKAEIVHDLAAQSPIAVVVDDDPVVLETMRASGHNVFAADWERRSGDEEQTLQAAQETHGRT
jgi:hypothetical protein